MFLIFVLVFFHFATHKCKITIKIHFASVLQMLRALGIVTISTFMEETRAFYFAVCIISIGLKYLTIPAVSCAKQHIRKALQSGYIVFTHYYKRHLIHVSN